MLRRKIDSVLAVTTQPTTSTIPSVQVYTAEDFIKACEQPVAVGTALTMATMLPLNFIAMFTMFTKMEKMFNPNHIKAAQRAARR